MNRVMKRRQASAEMVLVILACVGIFACAPGEQIARSDTTSPYCTADTLVRITRDSVGNLGVGLPLASLAERCARARTTQFFSFEERHPALWFPFPSLKATAYQNANDLDPRRPADGWEFTGCGGVLPGGVSTCATWAELTRAYGDDGTGSTEFGPAVVQLAKMPGFSFELDAHEASVGSLEVQPDLSRIPLTARLVRTRMRSSRAVRSGR